MLSILYSFWYGKVTLWNAYWLVGELIKTPVYDGNLLSNGHKIHGPAVVEEDTTTLVIEPGWLLELHKSGTYIIKRKDH